MKVEFNPNHPRAQKARLGRRLGKRSTQAIIIGATFGLTVLGILVLMSGNSLGYLVLSPVPVAVMLLAWLKGELSEIPARLPEGSDTFEIHQTLDFRVLGRSKRFKTPYDIWRAIRGTWRQQFFTVRYGILPDVFEYALSKEPADTEKVWQTALELAKKQKQPSVNSAVLFVALVTSLPNYEKYLADLHLEPTDLVVGIDWQRHIELVVERFKRKHYFGGFARDWAAGYTPLLNRVAHNISSDVQFGGLLYREGEAHAQTITQITNTLSNASRKNVALIGEVGVGKTTTVYAFAQKLLLDKQVPASLRYNQVVELNAANLLAHIDNQESLERILLGVFGEARAAKNIIIFLDEAEHFFASGTGSMDLSNVLLPILQNSAVRLIMAMTPGEWQRLTAVNQALAGVINYVAVPEPDEDSTMRILEDQVLLIEHTHKVTFTYQALLESYRLAGRYINDLVFPGRAIRLMEAAVNFAEHGVVTEASVQKSIEATRGVKVQAASGTEKQQLLNLEEEIHRRMINQKRAVSVVSNALRRARSGVGNPNKPIGTFLFLGPTGVGKTELAKAVAAAFFGGEEKIVRVDMNEFVQPSDVGRLLDSSIENGLLAHIQRQPFSVALFDEIEKAHPDVVNVFLQMLDEGMMRDRHNKTVSFRDAVVIATSNAGAELIRAQIQAGQRLEDFEEQFVNGLIEQHVFRPEFLNRFDEIVLFRPLSKEELMQVVDIMITGVNMTLARQKVQVSLTDAAKQWLVEHGYDARLGARPLRRTVQRSVENIVAQKLLEENFHPGSTLQLDAVDLDRFGTN